MTEHRAGCTLCGAELVYGQSALPGRCSYCSQTHETTVTCTNGHFVCDNCHSLSAVEIIERYCCHTTEADPLQQAMQLMNNPAVKMHGPEHHFLVPAVIVSAYCISAGKAGSKTAMILQARKRSADVKGGFCGSHGTCGAAMGAGIACSLITGSTPLSKDEWRLSNLMTASCLTAIANSGGPRCCKRDVFISIQNSVAFLNDNLNTRIPVGANPVCTFNHINRECIRSACSFYPQKPGVPYLGHESSPAPISQG